MNNIEQAKLKEKVLNILYNIGDLIKDTRKANNIRISDLAQSANVSTSVISELENHKGVIPNIYTLISITHALGLPDETLFEHAWKNVSKVQTFNDLQTLDKLKNALTDYGLPPASLNSVMDYIDYYVAINNLQRDYKIIKAIYDYELEEGNNNDHIMLDPLLIIEANKNIKRLEKIKSGIH